MNIASDATKKLLAIKFLKGVGDKSISSLAMINDFSNIPITDIVKLYLNKKHNFSVSEINEAVSKANQQVEIAEKHNHIILSLFDEQYPLNLKSANYAAPLLFCNGNISCLSEKNITVIGTREPTQHGKIITNNITEWFVKKGWNIVSGLALGVDSIAHTTCINSHGKTISVLAHGLEKIYPAKNKDLAKSIIENNGLLITEYPYNSYIGKINFVQRDSIQAAISTAVILIQTGIPGGSLHASRASLQFGRPLIIAGQSKSDIYNNEEKACGNNTLINASYDEFKRMLKINDFDKDLLLPLISKNHYELIENKLLAILNKQEKVFHDTNKNIKFDF